ncbi:hypothetical protein HK105_208439 [Polyrhizophydium stewartii]|uniref:Uncharacterized protein n=1 Tax=Polyrhizophydium stewartii TaxID=2732419 RepID=A0ABR4MXQ8_9FUNG
MTVPLLRDAASMLGKAGGDAPATSNIGYSLGAPVLTGRVNVYLIYYGQWTAAQRSVIEDFVSGVGGSAWWGIARQYFFQQFESSPRESVSDDVQLAGVALDGGSHGTALSGTALPEIIAAQIASGRLPEDAGGVYLVLTGAGVAETAQADLGAGAFCRDHCGYHASWVLASGVRIAYGHAGHAGACLAQCAPAANQRVSPNGDVAADALVNALAHVLAEAVTDPQPDGARAWQDADGSEAADKCAFRFGATRVDARGAAFNVRWRGRNFLVQQNWDPARAACALAAFPATPLLPSLPPPSQPPERPTARPTISPRPTRSATSRPAAATATATPTCSADNPCCRWFHFDC